MKLKSMLKNEAGSVMVLALIILVLLTLMGISATSTSTIEVQIASNAMQNVRDFYIAEAGAHTALETSSTWMTNAFLTANETGAEYTGTVDIDSDGAIDTNLIIHCIQDLDSGVANTNNLPLQSHIAPPPAGSGYSLKYFEVRRYGITASPANGNTQIQIGAYKVFNKF